MCYELVHKTQHGPRRGLVTGSRRTSPPPRGRARKPLEEAQATVIRPRGHGCGRGRGRGRPPALRPARWPGGPGRRDWRGGPRPALAHSAAPRRPAGPSTPEPQRRRPRSTARSIPDLGSSSAARPLARPGGAPPGRATVGAARCLRPKSRGKQPSE